MRNNSIKNEIFEWIDTIEDLGDLGFFTYNASLTTLTLSKGFYSILSKEDYNNEFLLEDFIDNYVHEDDFSKISNINPSPSTPKFEISLRLVDNFGFTRYTFITGKGSFDSLGNLLKISGVIKDISEEKYYEAKLKFTKELFSELVNNSYQIVYSMSEDGYFMSCSSNVFDHLGYTVDEVVGTHQCIFTDNETNNTLKKLRAEVMKTGLPKELVDYKIYHKDGSVRLNTTTIFYIRDNSLDIGMFWGIVKDITTTKIIENKLNEHDKKLKDREEWEKIKNEFIANISHELRTPVNVIYSSLQLFDLYIKNETLLKTKDKFEYYSKIMRQNCFRLLRLVNNLIECSKFDAGVVNLDMHKFDLVALTSSICNAVNDYVTSRKIKLTFNSDIPIGIINGNTEKIEIIILNLLSNAIKFSKKHGIINVTLSSTDTNIILSVKDNGIGISKEKQPNIFDRFTHANALFTRTNEGSGIGLSVVKSLVEIHNGTIKVISDEGVGSEFIITFPKLPISNKELNALNRVIHFNHAEQINIAFSDIYET
ncbi:MAG: PAS domain-containing sensor histidine kinase [Clostridium sp.]